MAQTQEGFDDALDAPSGTQAELSLLRKEMEDYELDLKSVASSVTADTSWNGPSTSTDVKPMPRHSHVTNEIASAKAKISDWSADVSPFSGMAPPARRKPSDREMQVRLLREELAETKEKLRMIKNAKDDEFLFRDAMEDEHQREILELQAQVTEAKREKRELARCLNQFYSSCCP